MTSVAPWTLVKIGYASKLRHPKITSSPGPANALRVWSSTPEEPLATVRRGPSTLTWAQRAAFSSVEFVSG
jgi:hypothetical protein